jgi:quercetin dioxygenase-like cupin family protein
MIDSEQKFVVTHFDAEHDFVVDTQRPDWMRRRTSIAEATQGAAGVRITRASAAGDDRPPEPLYNDVDLILRYMLRGSMRVHFSKHGEHLASAGSAWLQPPEVTHTVLGHSDDAEYLEFVMPGDFRRVDLPAAEHSKGMKAFREYPAETGRRLMSGARQQFLMNHLAGDQDFVPGRRVNSSSRDLGVTAATRGMITARIGRRHPPVPAVPERRHYHNTELQVVYLTRGWIRTEFEGQGDVEFGPGSCWTQPRRIEHAMRAYSADSFELFEVIIPADFGIIEVDDPVADRLTRS